MKVTLDSNEFSRDHTHVGSLSNAALLRIYWFAQGRLETWVGSRLLNLLNNMKVEIVSCRCFSVTVCMFHGNFDCNSDVLFSGICPWGPGSYARLISGIKRDALGCDRIWRARGEMGELSRCRCVS